QIVALTTFKDQYEQNPPNSQENFVGIFDYTTLMLKERYRLPAFQPSSTPTIGRFIFTDLAGGKYFAIVQAESSSGLLNDFVVVPVDPSGGSVQTTPHSALTQIVGPPQSPPTSVLAVTLTLTPYPTRTQMVSNPTSIDLLDGAIRQYLEALYST